MIVGEDSLLILMTEIYYSLDEYELSKNYASILAYNFPKSEWYEKSYNLINDLEGVSDSQKWYEKLNPIKIFIKEEENKINNTKILSIK